MRCGPLLLALLQWLPPPAAAHVAWTPIYVDGNSQVDLWTQKASGCACPWDDSAAECACCVRDGACHCGRAAPNRCSQCGLEQHCNNMCNMTIDSRYLSARSGKTFGQIKSPSLEGPGFCWYLLQPDSGQRVEIQVYRLVSVGRFNGTSCDGGFLQLVDGPRPVPRATHSQVCGGNERFTPPVVLFADKGPASLIFQISDQTLRSQFLAYFSFTPSNSAQAAGFQARGGRRIEHTECDWLYQDFSCGDPGSCVLASPGYPGLYPPNRRCKYLITTSSIHTRVHINFTNLLLPHNHCGTDYIAVYQGSTPASPLLTTLCSNRKAVLQYPGPNLLLEFSSGPAVPPYNYNGFLATLEFSKEVVTTEAPSADVHRTTDAAVLMDGTSAPRPPPPPAPPAAAPQLPGCDVTYSGAEVRSGYFDTRQQPWGAACRVTFVGRPTDIVHVSFFNFLLRSPSCQSSVDVYDGLANPGSKPINRVCSPNTRHARDPSGRFLDQQAFVSTQSSLTLVLKRQLPATTATENEFVDGAFLFHDEHVEGTLQPDSLCDVAYYGLSSSREGTVTNPGSQQIFWNIEGALRCSQRFVPAANQSVTLTVNSLARLTQDPHCHTQCGDGGCRCVTNLLPLAQMDHLLLATDDGQSLACLCGDFQQEWLPVSVRSWSPLRLVYSVPHYSWSRKGFSFGALYSFVNDGVCGRAVLNRPSGEIHSRNVSSPGAGLRLNFYYHLECTWMLDSKVERQLLIEMATDQSRPCAAWNVSVHLYDPTKDGGVGEALHTFCPRDRTKQYSLPWKTNAVLLRLRAMTRTPPEYSVRWRSQAVRANTRVSPPTQSPAWITQIVRGESTLTQDKGVQPAERLWPAETRPLLLLVVAGNRAGPRLDVDIYTCSASGVRTFYEIQQQASVVSMLFLLVMDRNYVFEVMAITMIMAFIMSTRHHCLNQQYLG
ncbi:uncharacterized protein LOC124798953 [Schistocerca piceifrons]|uniref:uncharacterized protein LOC124798953 n=1 Tax=Schistocerca piceifrons TaxID=274613 RepID=UPI001F5F3044|nr:uncharacterized protein LOC124798953 [Schistocerca piceifrons]